MIFVKTENLQKGMRLARPIYNKNGVLLYDRDTKLTRQGINSVKNFNLIGIYILEPTEPLPPMNEEDIEFERFQTMSVFGIREDIGLLKADKAPVNMVRMSELIAKSYARTDKKISTIQNLRSSEDYTYKHCLMISILSAAMAARRGLAPREIQEVIIAGMVHDFGMSELLKSEHIDENVKLILEYEARLRENKLPDNAEAHKTVQARILLTADKYDDMTAMKPGKEPSSEVAAVRFLLKNSAAYGDEIVGALVDSLHILYPGVCVELTNRAKGIVITENPDNVLRPLVLGFRYNEMYNLMADDVYKKVRIRDIMKTMDKRVKIDKATIQEYMERYNKKVF